MDRQICAYMCVCLTQMKEWFPFGLVPCVSIPSRVCVVLSRHMRAVRAFKLSTFSDKSLEDRSCPGLYGQPQERVVSRC